MRYFKNKELIELYNVSDKAIRNWIEAARAKSINLELYEENGRFFILDTQYNNQNLGILASRAKKYRNRKSHRNITPSSEFYEQYSQEQVIDIALNIDTFREFPHQYRYSGAGGTYWNEYLHKLYRAGQDNTLADTIKLLKINWDYIETLITDYKNVEVVDIGAGNGLVIKDFIQRLQETGKLRKYTCIDVSASLLDITETNIRNWCGSDLLIEKHIKDITFERISSIASQGHRNTTTIFLFFGGTITNFRNPAQALCTIHDSMAKEDILLTSLKLDSQNSRRYFDFHIEGDRSALLPLHDIQALQLLGIDNNLYESEQFYDEQRYHRFVQIKLKVALSMHFKTEGFEKLVEINKGDRILLWRVKHFSESELAKLYEQNNFENLLCIKSKNREYMLMISKVRPISH